jgi:hypothetical protein
MGLLNVALIETVTSTITDHSRYTTMVRPARPLDNVARASILVSSTVCTHIFTNTTMYRDAQKSVDGQSYIQIGAQNLLIIDD